MRSRGVTLGAARRAAEQVAAHMGVAKARTLDPLDEHDFLIIVSRLTKKLERAGDEQAATQAFLKALRVDWRGMSTEAVDRVVAASNRALAAHFEKRVLPAVRDVLDVEGPKMARSARAMAKKRYKIDITASLSQRDLAAEKAIRSSATNFVRDELGVRRADLSAKAREIVARGVAAGYGPRQNAKILGDAFDGQIYRSNNYWRIVAQAFEVRGRSYSQLSAFHDGGFSRFVYTAVGDEVTCDTCRFYDGQVFDTGANLSTMRDSFALDDPEQIKYAMPWVKQGRDENGAYLYVQKSERRRVAIARINSSGIGQRDGGGSYTALRSSAQLSGLGAATPPLHGHCRCTLLPD